MFRNSSVRERLVESEGRSSNELVNWLASQLGSVDADKVSVGTSVGKRPL
jgi:hypothetical protein